MIHDSDDLTRAHIILPNWDAAAGLKSKDHDRSVQGGDLTNVQYKQRLSSS